MGVQGADCHRHSELRRRTYICGNPQSLRRILQRQLLGELEYAELAAYADILLYVRCRHLGGTFRKVLQHLLGLYGNLVEIGSGILGKEGSCVR